VSLIVTESTAVVSIVGVVLFGLLPLMVLQRLS
jgi:hypothetical protein